MDLKIMDMKIPDLNGFIKNVSDIQRNHIPFALARALQEAGQLAKSELQKQVNSKINNGTSTTKNAAFGSRVEKGSQTVVVGIKDLQGRYLLPLFEGGARKLRPIESKFITESGSSKFLLPAEGVKRDSHGNVPADVQRMILDNARSRANGYYMTNKNIRYRDPSTKKSVAMFHMLDKPPKYTAKLTMKPVVEVFEKHFMDLFRLRLNEAVTKGYKPSRK